MQHTQGILKMHSQSLKKCTQKYTCIHYVLKCTNSSIKENILFVQFNDKEVFYFLFMSFFSKLNESEYISAKIV